uniref:Uncharacterized protein n=1 Tax=Anguilla anguilla TaxID=7936 RepID=A0A0E9WIK7_ANGAN
MSFQQYFPIDGTQLLRETGFSSFCFLFCHKKSWIKRLIKIKHMVQKHLNQLAVSQQV